MEFFGAAVSYKPLKNDETYRNIIKKEFNIITPDNSMKFKYIHPQKDIFDFKEADFIVDFALSNLINVRGHTLVWHQAIPFWLEEKKWNKNELMEIFENYIKTVATRYKDKVVMWDVVNEGIDDNGNLRESFWLKNLGPEYIEDAFFITHKYAPDVLLFYNDYNAEGLNKKSDAVYKLVKNLLRKNVPIHGVGFQMHISLEEYPEPKEVVKNMNRFVELGLIVNISEMDVRIKKPITKSKLLKQAELYEKMIEVAISIKNCNAFIMWGVTDKYSWIPEFFKGYDAGLLFDRKYNPKPAYLKLKEKLNEKSVVNF